MVSIRTNKRKAVRTLMLLVLVLLAMVVIPIHDSVQGTGEVEVQGGLKALQHPTGGVITAINVQNGDQVFEGAVLVELEGTELRAEFEIVSTQYYELLARAVRFESIEAGSATLLLDAEQQQLASLEPKFARTLATEASVLNVSEATEQGVRTGYEKQIEALTARLVSLDEQVALAQTDLAAKSKLLEDAVASQRMVDEIAARVAALRGDRNETQAQIAGLEVQIELRQTERLSEASEELSKLRPMLLQLNERRRELEFSIDRLALRAPVSGTVYGSTVDTQQGVMGPIEPVMYIVPADEPLIVKCKVSPASYDQLYVGQDVRLRFAAFDQRSTPEIIGSLQSISADTYPDPATGLTYYEVVVSMSEDEIQKLRRQPQPGMTVEAFMTTGRQSFFTYVAGVLTDSIARATSKV